MRESHDAQSERIVDYITAHVAEHGFPPSRRQLAEHLGVNVSVVQHHLDKMVEEGLLKRAPGIPRGISVSAAAMKQPEEHA